MIKIAVLGISIIFLTMMAGSIKREYAIAVTVGATVLLALYGVSSLKSIIERIEELQESIGVGEESVYAATQAMGLSRHRLIW